MTNEEMRAACKIAFIKCCADVGLKPSEFSDTEKMVFDLAFTAGAQWMSDKALEAVRRDHDSVMSLLGALEGTK
jgi:hypothetical protein